MLGAARRTLRELRELARSRSRARPSSGGDRRRARAVVVELAAARRGRRRADLRRPRAARAARPRAVHRRRCRRERSRRRRARSRFSAAAERAELAQASGLVLGGPVDALAAERYLFYALCSRPTRWLRVSWHDATDDGDAAAAFAVRRRPRGLLRRAADDRPRACAAPGAVAWGEAVGAARRRSRALERVLRGPRRRGPVIGPLAVPERLAALRGHDPHSPSALERVGGVPGRVVRRARPARPAARARRRCRWCAARPPTKRCARCSSRCGSGPAAPASTSPACAFALEALDGALAEPGRALSPNAARRPRRAAAAAQRPAALPRVRWPPRRAAIEPREFELAFGLRRRSAARPCRSPGVRSRCAGAIDRVDIDPGAVDGDRSTTTRPAQRRAGGALGRARLPAAGAVHARRRAAAGRRGASAGSTSRCAPPTCARAARSGPTSTRRRRCSTTIASRPRRCAS